MVNYTIYRMALSNKAKEKQVLKYFNGENDLLEILNQYYNFLKKDKIDYYDSKGSKRTFSITSDIEFNKKDRVLVSYLNSGFTGESFEILSESNSLNYPVSKNEQQSRRMFSFIHIPENSKYGYIVFENKAKHGVKVIFERKLQVFLNELGFQDYRIEMMPGLNFNYLSNMIEKGKLKKIRLIKYSLLHDVQLSLWDSINLNSDDQDVREWKFKNKTNCNLFKKELKNLFFSKVKGNEKILFMNKFEGDEISFEINHNGSSKTFNIKDKARMRSNIDVSKRLDFIDEAPTYISMKRVARELILEILDYKQLTHSEVA